MKNNIGHLEFSNSLRDFQDQLYLQLKTTQKQVVLLLPPESQSSSDTLTVDLARSFAAQKVSVVLLSMSVHADEILSGIFPLDKERTLLQADSLAALPEVLQPVDADLSLVLGGQLSGKLVPAIANGSMSAVIDKLKEQFDVVLISGEPLLSTPDMLLAASLADTVGLMISYRTTKKSDLDRALVRLRRNQIDDLFAVYVDVPSERTHYDF
ncbi:P-loop NTPase family protein [Lacticaseibacillus daqingensis]|uniref:hypothetical protein n=1 Tax=Lacticaseibacillus daqingensis TaxID=2486014 RepID=UPI000F7B5903|nr:hypothetical protein [Lacticaseibacillus daqingensis]